MGAGAVDYNSELDSVYKLGRTMILTWFALP